MASIVYNNARAEFARGSLSWTTGGSWRAMLVTGYTADADHVYVSSASAYEVTGTGYTGGHAGAGRKAITGRTVSTDTGTDTVKLDANDLAWSVLTIATGVGGVVLLWEQTSDSDSLLIAHFDIADTVPLTGQDLTVAWPAGGLITIT